MNNADAGSGGNAANDARAVDAGQGWAWIAGGWRMFAGKPGIWIALVVVLFVILFVLALVPVLGAIATFLLLPVFTAGLMLGCQSQERDGSLEIGHLFAGFKTRTSSLVVVGALSIVAFVLVMIPVILIVGAGAFFGAMSGGAEGMMAIGGSMLLAWLVALALSIPVYMALWFAPALVALHGSAPMEAIKQSFLGCLKNIVPFLVYGIVALVLAVAATIPLGLGWLVLGPVLAASVYVAYRDIYPGA